MNQMKKFKGILLANSWCCPSQGRVSLYTHGKPQKEFLIEGAEADDYLEELVTIFGEADNYFDGESMVMRDRIRLKELRLHNKGES